MASACLRTTSIPLLRLLPDATVNWPLTYGSRVQEEVAGLGAELVERAETRYTKVFPPEPDDIRVVGYLWAHTIRCPYCNGLAYSAKLVNERCVYRSSGKHKYLSVGAGMCEWTSVNVVLNDGVVVVCGQDGLLKQVVDNPMTGDRAVAVGQEPTPPLKE